VANGVAIDGRGNTDPADDRVYVVGSFDTALTFPGATTLSGSTSSGFLLRTDANGAPVQFGALPSSGPPNTPYATINRVAVGPNGNITVAGTFGQVLDLDPGPGTNPLVAVGTRSGLVAEYTPSFGFVRDGLLISFP